MFLKRERLETDYFGRTNNQFVKALFCIFSSPTNLHIRADKGFAPLPPSGHVREECKFFLDGSSHTIDIKSG